MPYQITELKCAGCGRKIVGNSPKHAQFNLLVHQTLSIKCKEIKNLRQKQKG